MPEHRSDAQEGFSAPIPLWGRVRLGVTQSPGTAMGEESPPPLTHAAPGSRCGTEPSAGVLLLTSSPPSPLRVLSHSPAAPGCPRRGYPSVLSSFLSRRGRKGMMLLFITTSAAARASGQAQIYLSLIVLSRLFQPIYFFFSVFEGKLSHIQMWNSTVEFLSKGRSCLGRY